jgi:hypothetical protein
MGMGEGKRRQSVSLKRTRAQSHDTGDFRPCERNLHEKIEAQMNDRNTTLNVAKVMDEFKKQEESPSRRNGTFKINAPFDKALDTILKAKPEPKKYQK